MTTISFDALGEKLSAHIELNKSRMDTLVMLITGMIGSRTVNLSHVASEHGAAAKVARAPMLKRSCTASTVFSSWTATPVTIA